MGATSALFFSALARLAHFLPWSAACLFTMTLPKRGGTARAIMSEMNRKCLILNTLRSTPGALCLGQFSRKRTRAFNFNFPRGDADIQSSSTSRALGQWLGRD